MCCYMLVLFGWEDQCWWFGDIPFLCRWLHGTPESPVQKQLKFTLRVPIVEAVQVSNSVVRYNIPSNEVWQADWTAYKPWGRISCAPQACGWTCSSWQSGRSPHCPRSRGTSPGTGAAGCCRDTWQCAGGTTSHHIDHLSHLSSHSWVSWSGWMAACHQCLFSTSGLHDR